MKQQLWGFAIFVFALLATNALAAQPWSGYLGEYRTGVQDLPSYVLPTWVHKASVPCVVATRDFNNDGVVDRKIWGVEYTKWDGTIGCFVPRRGGGNNKEKGSGASTSPPPPPPPPPCEDVTMCEMAESEVCDDEETSCEEPVCHEERTSCKKWNYREVCTGHGHHSECEDVKTTCKEWRTREVCDDPVCVSTPVCHTVSVEVCSTTSSCDTSRE